MDACKVCYAELETENGIVGMDIYKDPITDTGKKSKRGQLKLINLNGELTTVRKEEYPEIADELVVDAHPLTPASSWPYWYSRRDLCEM